jgi:type IV pilus assembly protein PilN
MAKINLLPWRTERRKQREREFYMMLASAAVAAVLAILLWYVWMNARLDNQDSRNAFLKDQIHQLDEKLTEIKRLEEIKSKLLARKQIIEQLQANRSQMVHLFDELVKTVPDGVRLVSLKQAGDTLTLDGLAQSNASVATYMRNLDASDWLKRTDLQKTEAKGNDKRDRFEFDLTVKLTSPEEKEKERAKAAGTADTGATAGAGDKTEAKPAATPAAVPATTPAVPATTPPPPNAGGKS